MKPYWKLAAAWTAAFWIGCVAVPLAALFGRVASGAEFWATLADPAILAIARATFAQAAVSTLCSAAIGLPLGLWAGTRGRVPRWAGALLAMPFGVPTVVVALAWVTWLGRSGWLAAWGLPLDWAYSLKAVILAHVFLNAPFVALVVAHARALVPRAPLEAAETLGASAWATFRFVTWPRVSGALAASCAQVLSLCTMSFALVLVLGGGPPVETLETALYGRMRYGRLDIAGAAACALWELLLTLGPWIFVLAIRARTAGRPAPPQGPPKADRWGGSSNILLVPICALFVVPYLAVLAGGAPRTLSRVLADEQVARAISLSLRLAFATALACSLTVVAALVTIDGLSARARAFVSAALSVPAGISVLVLGLGTWLAYGRWLDPFEGNVAPMVALQTALFFPVAFRMLLPVLEGSQTRLLEAAGTLGASPLQAFRLVEWPRWRGPLLSAAALVGAASLGEVAAVSLFYSERLVPLPLLISRWSAQYRFEEAAAVSALLFLLSAGVAIVVRMERS